MAHFRAGDASLSLLLQQGIRFFRYLKPTRPSHFSRSAFLIQGTVWGFHVPLSGGHVGLGTHSKPEDFTAVKAHSWNHFPVPIAVLAQASSHFRLLRCHDSCVSSHMFTHTNYLALTRFEATRRRNLLRFPSRAARARFVTLSGPLLIQAPRFTRQHEWFDLNTSLQ